MILSTAPLADDDVSKANRHLTTPITGQRRPIVSLQVLLIHRRLLFLGLAVRLSNSRPFSRLDRARLRPTHENRSADGTAGRRRGRQEATSPLPPTE